MNSWPLPRLTPRPRFTRREVGQADGENLNYEKLP